MTPAEALKRECEEVTGRLGFYIPPYRMTSLMQAAQKITSVLVNANTCMTHAECEFVLNIVSGAFKAAVGKENNSNDA